MGRGLLILTSGFLIVLGIVQKGMISRQQTIPVRTINYSKELQVRNLANSLMDYAVAEIDNNQHWTAGFYSNDFFGGTGSVTVYTYDDYVNDPATVPSDHDIYNWTEYSILVVSEVIKDNLKATTEVALTKDAFSKYTYFTDVEPGGIYFFDGDTLTGPVHTNGTLNIAGSPVFEGDVTSPNEWEGHPSYENDPQFLGVTDFTHERIELPLGEGMAKLEYAAQNGGLKFNEEIFVEFLDNGSVNISTLEGTGGDWWDPEPIWSDPVNYNLNILNGVISSSKDVYTKGTLKGQVTLHSGSEIQIMGDLRYNTNPAEDSTSTDLLGLVSEGDVIVDKDAHRDHGTKDLDIHASIMAIDKSFTVEDWDRNSARGSINLIGGLQQKERGPVGTFNGSSIQSGFSKSYEYDQRLYRMVPPAYPRESFYTKVYWKEKPVATITN